MSKHLFDLEQLERISNADGWFRSDAPATHVVDVVAMIRQEREVATPMPGGDSRPYVVMGLPAGATIVEEERHARVMNHLRILEQALADGRPDLYGMDGPAYRSVSHEVRSLEQEAERGGVTAGWKLRLKELGLLVGGAKNLAELIITIRGMLA